jgi:class 3 adenylate cyclase/predicted ATPase
VDVKAWLSRLGLEQYERTFRDNDVDGEVLPELTAEDLIDLGVTSIGHRRRMLAAITLLREQPVAESEKAGLAAAPTENQMGHDPAASTAERRQLTVMFCDLVGSTALSTQFDPEDMREIIGAYHHTVADIVADADGFISRFMGDGVLVYFGYPQAHEDDAERAVRAGLRILEAVRRLDVKSVKLQTRVGIATGLVVVGDLIGKGSAQEQSVVGETPNLAARLQTLAEPETVVISAGTRRLLGDLFECRDLGAVALKGMAAPVQVWQVLRPSVVASRFEALRGSALTRLVGRDEEIDLLMRRWARAKAGNGQIVLISGEAGIGKSRIVAALNERLDAESAIRLRHFCSPYHQDSALFPVVDRLGRAAGFTLEDAPAAKLEKLETMLALAPRPKEDIALLAELLSLPASERHPLPELSPQRKKERTLEALIRQLEGLAHQQPLVMVFEDAHWIDPTSSEMLDLTVERVRSLRVLLIITYRPEFQPPWMGQPQVTTLTLNRLDRPDRTALVEQIAGGKALPEEVINQIADRTDGVPLFVEELTKSVLESGLLREEAGHYVLDRALPPLAIPATLHDSLMARLDRLASVRLVAQIGAAIGREFSYALLRAVCRLSESELDAALTRLVGSGLVFQRGAPPEAVYSFKHALVQDAAHGSLLRNARQQLHAHIADALETHFPELIDSQPELLARHYAEAGLIEKSVSYWARAGRRSSARSAMSEAAAQFQKGLNELARLPDTRQRQQQELELWTALGATLRFVKGQAAPEMGQAYGRARELWERLDFPAEYLQILYGQIRYHTYRGEFDLAQRLSEDLLRLSRQRNDLVGLVLGHQSSARDLMLVGRFAASRSHAEEVLALYDPISHRARLPGAGDDPRVISQAFLGINFFCLGFPDQGLARSKAAIAEARRLADPSSMAVSLALGARLVSLVGDDAVFGQWVEQLLAIATEQAFPYFRAQGTVFRGWVKVKNGEVSEGLSLMRSGSNAFRATGTELWLPYFSALMAGACEIAGQLEDAAILLDDTLQIVEKTGERWLEAELRRHKGRLLLRQGDSEAAEELYCQALTIAEEQQAKLWQLRAAVNLAELRRDQGRRSEAHDLLAPVYGWFTEGFDTQDLKGAKALLDELS